MGTGQVSPNIEAIREDTPPKLRKLVLDCIQYQRDNRPLFQHVLAEIDGLQKMLPKTHRSLSEPILYRPGITSELLGSTAGSGGPAEVATAPTKQPSVLA